MEEGRSLQDELLSDKKVLKQLEGVYNTSSDVLQKKRVAKDINVMKKEIKSLEGKLVVLGIENEIMEEEDTGIGDDYDILGSIAVNKVREDSKDREIDAITSYLNYFEKNYLSILSEYYIKLDFNHSGKRDEFYPKFMEIKKIINEYNYELDVLNREEYNSIAFYRDKSLVHKIKHRYLLVLDKYFKELNNFLKILIDDNAEGGIIVLNSNDRLILDELERNRKLDGYTVLDTIIEMYDFSEDIIKFLSLPDI
ncbi:MAG TPA: hypothetical protein ENI15_10195 [Spirochaetes bacterium]|nr:hypothetical protein [Spirochaetota bacterium]